MFILAESALMSTGLEVFSFIVPLLATVITIAISALLKKGVDRLGVKRSQEVDDMIDKYVGIGVSYAKQAAEKKLEGRELTSGDKLGLATKTVLGELKQSGVKGVAEDLIVARIEAMLNLEGAAKKLG